jgi:hypothetical protein
MPPETPRGGVYKVNNKVYALLYVVIDGVIHLLLMKNAKCAKRGILEESFGLTGGSVEVRDDFLRSLLPHHLMDEQICQGLREVKEETGAVDLDCEGQEVEFLRPTSFEWGPYRVQASYMALDITPFLCRYARTKCVQRAVAAFLTEVNDPLLSRRSRAEAAWFVVLGPADVASYLDQKLIWAPHSAFFNADPAVPGWGRTFREWANGRFENCPSPTPRRLRFVPRQPPSKPQPRYRQVGSSDSGSSGSCTGSSSSSSSSWWDDQIIIKTKSHVDPVGQPCTAGGKLLTLMRLMLDRPVDHIPIGKLLKMFGARAATPDLRKARAKAQALAATLRSDMPAVLGSARTARDVVLAALTRLLEIAEASGTRGDLLTCHHVWPHYPSRTPTCSAEVQPPGRSHNNRFLLLSSMNK